LPGESFIPVAGQTLSVLEAIKVAPLGDVRMRRLGAATATEAAQLMGHLLALHLPRALRSIKLIAALS
jgi:hypothetical protein